MKLATVTDTEVQKLHPVWRSQPGGHFGIAWETLDEVLLAVAVAGSSADHLDRRRPRQQSVLATPNLAHATRAESLGQPVTAERDSLFERFAQARDLRFPPALFGFV